MPDWRFVTQVNSAVSGTTPTITHGMWIDLDGVDTIMQMEGTSHGGARTRFGWLSGGMWHYIFALEQIDPTTMSGDNNPQQEGE